MNNFDSEPQMHLHEALSRALSDLRAFGHPQVLSLHQGLFETMDRKTLRNVRVYEVRLRWADYKKDPYCSLRGPMITEARHRASNAWSAWERCSRPFSVDDLELHSYWSVRPQHAVSDPCKRCEHDEDVTDAELEQIHGKGPEHTCALRLYEDH